MSKRILTGLVVSNKMSKSIVVKVEKTLMHPIYKKFFKSHKKFVAHDDKQVCKIGDLVRIVEATPISKTKKWQLLEIVKKGESLDEIVEETKELEK